MRTGLRSALFVVAGLLAAFAAQGYAGAKWAANGTFVEGCSCMGVCPCEQTGLRDGCQGVGTVKLTSGSTYDGVDISGATIVYAAEPGTWVRLYVDAPDKKQNEAAKGFANTYFSALGKIESVKDAKIEMTGSDGKYTVLVDGGTIMKLETEPVMGGDGKSPISHSNTKSVLNPTIYQGRTVSCTYKDGEKSFTLEGSNSYFNQKMKSTSTAKD